MRTKGLPHAWVSEEEKDMHVGIGHRISSGLTLGYLGTCAGQHKFYGSDSGTLGIVTGAR